LRWGLYGPLKDAILLGSAPAGQLPANLTVTAVIGAALAGAGGPDSHGAVPAGAAG
jgi:hypothetical protein